MKNNWTRMREDAVRELKRIYPEIEVESAESGTTRSHKKTSAVLWIIFWVVIIGGAITLFELLRK
jgi:hypothetical protein